MSDPRVSIVIASFNRPRLLARALQSLVGQAFTDFEVVVVNDGGTDVRPVANRFGALDIQVVDHPVNRGVTAAQNTGARAARGALINFLNDDDLFLPHHLETVVAAHDEHGPNVVVYTDGAQVHEDDAGRPITRTVLPRPDGFDPDLLLVTNYIPAITLLIPTAAWHAVGGFDESLEVLEDWELWIRLSKALPFVHLPVVTTEYHLRGGRGNITTREVPRFHACLERVYEKHPVDDPDLVSKRAEMLAGSRPRGRQFLVEQTQVVSASTAPELQDALRRVVDDMGDQSFEVIAVVPPTDEMRALGAQVTGDFTMVFSDDLSPDVVEEVGRRKAAGRAVRFDRDRAEPGLGPGLDPPGFVIVGTGRSGSGFISRVLTEAGIRTGHEEWWNPFGQRQGGLAGDSSWLAVPFLDDIAAKGASVLHQLRHPLAVLSSLLNGDLFDDPNSAYRAFMAEHVEFTGEPAVDAVRFIVRWWELAEEVASLTWQVEQVDADLVRRIGDAVGIPLSNTAAAGAVAAVPTTYNKHRAGPSLTWADLPAIPERARMRTMAAGFGYEA